MEVLAWYSIVSPQMPLGLAPEILDAIDMVSSLREIPAVIDALMMEPRDIEPVVGMPGITVNERHRRLVPGIGDHDRMNTARPLQQTKDGDFSGSASAPFAFAMPTETAFIDFDLTGKGRVMSTLFSDDFAQLAVIQGRHIAIDAHKFGGTPRGCARNEVLQKPFLGANGQSAAPTCFHRIYQAFIGLPMPAPKSFW